MTVTMKLQSFACLGMTFPHGIMNAEYAPFAM
jgi:hypothetical protein